MSELTYIYTIQVNNYATIDDLKVAIIKTLARWFPNHYVFNEHAVESWVKKDETDVDVLYSNTFQFELSVKSENVYYLIMYAIGRYRRHGSSCDFFERVLDCLEYQLGHPDIEFVTMQTARTNKQQDEQTYYPETSLWPIHSINESPLPIAGAIAETVVYDEAEDAESLEDFDDEDESENESSDDEDSDDEDSDDEDELIMSMPLRHMNDAQIEQYVELCGRCPRDECEEWEMMYTGGAILRYSYCKFIQWHIEDQTVSNITISRAIFDETTFTNYVFNCVVFEECVFKDIVLNNTTFKNCRFIDCEMDSSIVPDDSCRVEDYYDSDEDA